MKRLIAEMLLTRHIMALYETSGRVSPSGDFEIASEMLDFNDHRGKK